MPNDIDWDGYERQEPNISEPEYQSPASTKEGILPLGHDRGMCYYLSQSSRQIVALSAAQHTKQNLSFLASKTYYWERSRFNTGKKIDWDNAADWLMNECKQCGIYNPDLLRGRGAWIDDGRSVLHLGDRLIVDGQSGPLVLAGSTHIYEAARPLSHIVSSPLKTAEAHRLVQICKMLRFENPKLDAILFAGFIAIAPICGGLAWRPSIWMVGASGSGKSYIEDNILVPCLGGMALQVQSKTTEAGVRQALGSDARPVIFGEAESEDAHAAQRMQAVLDLVRQSASEGGADIIKGSKDQKAAIRFRIRSCFSFSSINSAIAHQADQSRVTVLALQEALTDTPEQKAAASAQFDRLKQAVADTITPQFAAGLIARSVKLLPVIRANAETFSRAVAAEYGSKRQGDQIGALLAGASSLHTERVLTLDEAKDWLKRHEILAHKPPEAEKDEVRLLSTLTQHCLRVALGSGPANEFSIGNLIETALTPNHDANVTSVARETAERVLKQIGIKAEAGADHVKISTGHPRLREILHGTPWHSGWGRALLRVQDVLTDDKTVRFSGGYVSKAVHVPVLILFPE